MATLSSITDSSYNIRSQYYNTTTTNYKVNEVVVKELNKKFSKSKPKQFVMPDESKLTYKEFVIPKKSGKVRKVCCPSPELKLLQRHTLKRLYRDYETLSRRIGTYELVHGFVPSKNVVTAAQKHIGYDSTTMMDIKDFFDSVTEDMIKLSGVAYDKHSFHKEGYTAQGFCTSPILACIATIDMVKNIDDRLREAFGSYAFTMYADDIQVSINNPDKAKIKQLTDIITQEVQKAGFEINHAKTRTKFAKYGYRRILGVNVGDDKVRATRKTMRKIRAAQHGGNKSSLGGLVTWSKCSLPK